MSQLSSSNSPKRIFVFPILITMEFITYFFNILISRIGLSIRKTSLLYSTTSIFASSLSLLHWKTTLIASTTSLFGSKTTLFDWMTSLFASSASLFPSISTLFASFKIHRFFCLQSYLLFYFQIIIFRIHIRQSLTEIDSHCRQLCFGVRNRKTIFLLSPSPKRQGLDITVNILGFPNSCQV